MIDRNPFVYVFAFALGVVAGLVFLAQPVEVNLPLTGPLTQVAPDLHEPVVHYVSASTVLDLVDVLNGVHKEAEGLKEELQATREEATKIIQAMIAEIQRLQSRPAIVPQDMETVSK